MADDDSRLPEWADNLLHPNTAAGRMGRDIVSVLLVALLIGVILFSYAGVWPPFVTVLSGSMEPNIQEGDVIMIVSPDKSSPDGAYGTTGVVPANADADYTRFGAQGDVIVYAPNGDGSETPIIHRAEFWVEEGENWYDEADKDSVGFASNCNELPNCPAPNDGFITKGDANGRYDQVSGFSRPVRPDWIRGVARFRVGL